MPPRPPRDRLRRLGPTESDGLTGNHRSARDPWLRAVNRYRYIAEGTPEDGRYGPETCEIARVGLGMRRDTGTFWLLASAWTNPKARTSR